MTSFTFSSVTGSLVTVSATTEAMARQFAMEKLHGPVRGFNRPLPDSEPIGFGGYRGLGLILVSSS